MEEIKRKEKRVGTYTFGAMLIIIGISVMIMTFTKMDLVKYILMLWPVALIGFGIEIIYLSSKSDIKMKIDFASIILMCVVLFFTGIFSIGNYFVNKVLYDDEVKSFFIDQYINNDEYGKLMNKEVRIQVEDKDKVTVTVVRNKDYKDSSYARIRLKTNANGEITMRDAVNFKNEIYEGITKTGINLEKLPEFVKKIEITIYTDNINNVQYDGDIISL